MNSTIFLRFALAILGGSFATSALIWTGRSSGEQLHPTAQQLITALEKDFNDDQAAALADGILTRAEYDSARQRVVSCLEANGLEVHREPGRGPGGVDELWAESGPSAGDLGNVFLNCYARYQGKLGLIWAEQNRPTADALAQRETAIDSCLTSKGVRSMPLSELWASERDRDAYFECLSEVPPP